jgi:hypothetical protein
MMRTCHDRRGWLLIGGMLALGFALAGCSSDKKKQQTTSPPVIAQTSAANCLHILKNAYTGKDIDAYAQLFTNDFTFVFYSVDYGNQQTPQQWGLADELESAHNMFTIDTVQGITLSFVAGDTISSASIFPDTWKEEMTEINLRLDTHTVEGTALAVEVSSGHSTFYFKEFLDQHPTPGTNLWRIYRWEDRGFATIDAGAATSGSLVEHKTWGQLKAQYR